MKKIILVSVSVIVLLALITCKKGSDDPEPVDFAANAAGMYTGIYNVPDIGQIPGSMKLTKITTTTVDITMTVTGQIVQTLPGATASDGGSGRINIVYTSEEGDLSGTVNGKTFSARLISYGDTTTFTGTRP
jgi:hypothetical protein